MARLDDLKAMLAKEPGDVFLQYALGMEYAKLGRHEEALAAFGELRKLDPNYVAGYFMAGRTCEQKGDIEEAKRMYREGIAVAQRIGDGHAAGEMSTALMMIE